MHGGHYTAYTSLDDGSWVELDDDRVINVSWSTAREASSDASLIMYKRTDYFTLRSLFSGNIHNTDLVAQLADI